MTVVLNHMDIEPEKYKLLILRYLAQNSRLLCGLVADLSPNSQIFIRTLRRPRREFPGVLVDLSSHLPLRRSCYLAAYLGLETRTDPKVIIPRYFFDPGCIFYIGSVMHLSCRANTTNLAKQWIRMSNSRAPCPVIFVTSFMKVSRHQLLKILLRQNDDRCFPRILIQKHFESVGPRGLLQTSRTNLWNLSLRLDADFSKSILQPLAFEANTFNLRQGAGECSWSLDIYW